MKVCYIYTTGFYSCKEKVVMKFVDKWIKLKNIILDEVTKTQRNKYHTFSIICGYKL